MKLLRIAQRFFTQKRFSHILKSTLPEISVPTKSITEYIFQESHQWKDKPLISCGATNRTIKYGEIKEQIENFSRSLTQKMGLKRGQVIGLILPNIPEFITAIHGGMEAGLAVTFVNPLYTEEEILRQFEDAEAVSIVTIPELRGVADKVGSKLAGYRGTVVVGGGGDLDLIQMSKPNQLKPISSRPDVNDIAILPYSSGTTGLPKGVKLSHYNCIANVEQMSDPLIVNIPQTTESYQEKSLSVLPFFHIYGLNGIMNFAIKKGVHVITIPKFTPEAYVKCLLQYKPTTLFLVPSLLVFLACNPAITTEHLSSVQRVVCGAAPATKTLINLFREKIGSRDVTIQQGYGMTETSPCTLVSPFNIPDPKTGSTGILLGSTEAKVLSMTTGEELPVNKPGELCIRGPQVMIGYLKNEKATKETVDSEGWLHTGDVAYYDEDQYFYITDRTKELIKVKGNQVSPTELESVMMQIDGVADVAVIGIPDELSGELPKAFIVCHPGAKLSDTDVLKFVETKVAPYKKLSGGIKFLDAIPRNAAGKILRHELKKLN